MADRAQASASSSEPQLKYLGFLRVAVLQVYLLVLGIYEHLKDKSGPLKSGIQNVEGTVLRVVGPVLDRVNFNLDDYFVFVDKKVDGTIQFADERLPEDVKQRAVSLYSYASAVPDKAKAIVAEVNEKGALPAFQSYVDYWVPVFWAYVQQLWSFFTSLPLVPQLLASSQPLVVVLAEQYNSLLASVQKSDIPIVKKVGLNLPAVPVEKLKRSE
jgi:hypothetical protein